MMKRELIALKNVFLLNRIILKVINKYYSQDFIVNLIKKENYNLVYLTSIKIRFAYIHTYVDTSRDSYVRSFVRFKMIFLCPR